MRTNESQVALLRGYVRKHRKDQRSHREYACENGHFGCGCGGEGGPCLDDVLGQLEALGVDIDALEG